MTMNCKYGSEVGVILPVVSKILPIVHLKLKLTKTHPLFYTFCQKHSGEVFSSGKNGSTPNTQVAKTPYKNVSGQQLIW